ncbi:hypothetical protein BN988_02790 [Oceanobacillus picturae]|uniref:Uncharacterized protein n=2 Tax=Oceanobacillus picturae TaxID=171693 RepID=W9AFI3_9BACI|nr:hypothetical protein BN988_02790 [Oceanobacillus picturae]
MNAKGYLLEGIFANLFHTTLYNKEIILHVTEPILYIRKNTDKKYWKIGWTEDDAGDDYLLSEEQETPEPLEYELEDPHQRHTYQKHIISSSSFSIEHNLIKEVIGYGSIYSNRVILSAVVLELEDSFLSIEAVPAVEMRVTNKEPKHLGDVIFSTD